MGKYIAYTVGAGAVVAGVAYLSYSVFTSRANARGHHNTDAKEAEPSSPVPHSQLAYEEQGVLDLLQYDQYRHIGIQICAHLLATPHKLRNYVVPKGLPNYGNSCYLNALLQALTACDAFEQYLTEFSTMYRAAFPAEEDAKLPYLTSLSKLLTSIPFLWVIFGRDERGETHQGIQASLRPALRRLHQFS